ncbi:MAG: bacteriohemerythrin [Candidatus Thiodiazotropha sp.]
MPTVTWSDEFNINVKEIDEQHQKMLEIVNNLHTAVEENRENEILNDLLIALYHHTQHHFATEEELMKKHDYPGYEQHLHEHKVLLQHLGNLVEGVSSGKNPSFRSDYDVSSDWVLIHIFKSDKDLGLFLNDHAIF